MDACTCEVDPLCLLAEKRRKQGKVMKRKDMLVARRTVTKGPVIKTERGMTASLDRAQQPSHESSVDPRSPASM